VKRLFKKLRKRVAALELLHVTIAGFVVTAVLIAFGIGIALYVRTKPASSEDFLNMAQTIAYALGLLTASAAAAIAYRSQRMKEVDTTNRRFKDAVTSLSKKDIFVRIEGIYSLERLAFNAPNANERQRVAEVLCAFLRERLKYVKPKDKEEYTPLEKGIDHTTVLEVLKRLREKFGKLDYDLSFTDLAKMDFENAHFAGVNLRASNLQGANLRGAYLFWARLSEADLSGAYLSGANLSEAALCGADLRGAFLHWARLS
jgi:uncharacterized protein YjbI with pentapeptide repeats